MKRDEAPEKVQVLSRFVVEFELYSIDNKYGDVIKSMFQKYDLQGVVEFRCLAV